MMMVVIDTRHLTQRKKWLIEGLLDPQRLQIKRRRRKGKSQGE